MPASLRNLLYVYGYTVYKIFTRQRIRISIIHLELAWLHAIVILHMKNMLFAYYER